MKSIMEGRAEILKAVNVGVRPHFLNTEQYSLRLYQTQNLFYVMQKRSRYSELSRASLERRKFKHSGASALGGRFLIRDLVRSCGHDYIVFGYLLCLMCIF